MSCLPFSDNGDKDLSKARDRSFMLDLGTGLLSDMSELTLKALLCDSELARGQAWPRTAGSLQQLLWDRPLQSSASARGTEEMEAKAPRAGREAL